MCGTLDTWIIVSRARSEPSKSLSVRASVVLLLHPAVLPPRETHTKILIAHSHDLHSICIKPTIARQNTRRLHKLSRLLCQPRRRARKTKQQKHYFFWLPNSELWSNKAKASEFLSKEWHYIGAVFSFCLYLWVHKSGDLLWRHVLREESQSLF